MTSMTESTVRKPIRVKGLWTGAEIVKSDEWVVGQSPEHQVSSRPESGLSELAIETAVVGYYWMSPAC